MLESALVVLVPAAEDVVAPFRRRHDPSAALGVPAHVTTLYPFRPPDALTDADFARLRDLFLSVPAFTAVFARTARFPGVLYLAPEPAAPFRQLTELVLAHFPGLRPYGGAHAEIIPHLTIAQVPDPALLDQVAADFHQTAGPQIPFQASVETVALLDNTRGPWQVSREFALGRPGRAG